MSHETISRIVDRVQPRLVEWQSRQLKPVYSFLYVDALAVNVKSDGRAQNKAMYVAVSLAASRVELECLINKWDAIHPSATRVWADNFRFVEQLFDYPAEVRKMIYTTNMIEAFNAALRKVTNRKAAFPNDDAVFKALFLRTLDVVKKWTLPVHNWAIIRGKLDIVLGLGWDSCVIEQSLHKQLDRAASDFIDSVDNAVLGLEQFPYFYQVHLPPEALEREYRMLHVNKYVIMYSVFENVVEISRIIYARIDISKIVK